MAHLMNRCTAITAASRKALLQRYPCSFSKRYPVTTLTNSIRYQSTESEERSLWDRMGGEATIKPMVSDIYDRHCTDPLTKDFFGGGKFENTGDHDKIKELVFRFFSAGIGGK